MWYLAQLYNPILHALEGDPAWAGAGIAIVSEAAAYQGLPALLLPQLAAEERTERRLVPLQGEPAPCALEREVRTWVPIVETEERKGETPYFLLRLRAADLAMHPLPPLEYFALQMGKHK